MGEPLGNIPAWLQVLLVALTSAGATIIAVVKLGSSFDKRLQRLENHNLDQHIDSRIGQDWHEHRYPMLQTRVFADLDKMSDNIARLGQDVAVLIARDKMDQRIEKLISALNKQAMIPKED